MNRTLRTAVVLLAVAAPASVAAAANPFYLTGKRGDTTIDADLGDSLFPESLAGDDGSWSLGLGFRFGRWVAFQIEYHDLGTVPGRTDPRILALTVPSEGDSTAVSVSALPQVRLTERLTLFGKLGFVSWQSDVSAIQDTGRRFLDDFSDEDLLWGAGLRYDLPGPIDVFGEFESLAASFESISIGGTWGF